MTVALVAGGVIGYFGASYQYSSILSKARAAFPSQPTMMSVSGTVQSISGNTITMKSTVAMNPFENLPEIRMVTVTDTTKIVKLSSKDQQVFQAEMDAYQKSISKTASKTSTSSSAVTTPLAPPSPMKETVVKLSDLKAGDMIVAEAREDVKMQASFEAVRIMVTWTAPAAMTTPTAAAAAGAVNNVPPPTGTAPAGTAPIVNTPPPPAPTR